jgi:hypothetical protein
MANTTISTMLATTAVLTLAACGGGGSTSGTGTSVVKPETLSITLPATSASRMLDVSNATDFAEIVTALNSAKVGDGVEIPLELALRALGDTETADQLANIDPQPTVTLIVGQGVVQKTLNYVILNENSDLGFAGERGLNMLGTFDQFVIRAVDADFDTIEYVANPDRNLQIYFGTETDTTGFTALEGSVESLDDDGSYVTARVRSALLDGNRSTWINVDAASATFTNPNGQFTYNGRGALQWDDNVALGDVTMSTNFGASSTATISANDLITHDNLSAGFSGNLTINNVSGLFGSNSAQITIGENSIDAGIIGAFNGDASFAGGAIFDAATAGENAAGVFSLVKD